MSLTLLLWLFTTAFPFLIAAVVLLLTLFFLGRQILRWINEQVEYALRLFRRMRYDEKMNGLKFSHRNHLRFQ